MVLKGTSKEKSTLLKNRLIYPTKISELKDSIFSKFMIKFGAEYCPPCRNFQSFLTTTDLESKIDTGMYIVQLDGKQDDIARDLGGYFKFKSIPYCVVTDRSLKLIDSMTGFSEEEFKKMFKRHFS